LPRPPRNESPWRSFRSLPLVRGFRCDANYPVRDQHNRLSENAWPTSLPCTPHITLQILCKGRLLVMTVSDEPSGFALEVRPVLLLPQFREPTRQVRWACPNHKRLKLVPEARRRGDDWTVAASLGEKGCPIQAGGITRWPQESQHRSSHRCCCWSGLAPESGSR
jgi:hypothetical protein